MAEQKEIEKVRRELWSWSRDRRQTMQTHVLNLPREQAVELVAGVFTASRSERKAARNRRFTASTLGAVSVIFGAVFGLIGWVTRDIEVVPYCFAALTLTIIFRYLSTRGIIPGAALPLLAAYQDARFVPPTLNDKAMTLAPPSHRPLPLFSPFCLRRSIWQ